MNPRIKRLISTSLVGILLLASTKLLPANMDDLENKIEISNYKIRYLKEIGDAELKYTEAANNKYIIEINGETGGLVNTTFLNRVYKFKTEGDIKDRKLFPRYYNFVNRDKSNHNSIETVQSFDFKKLEVNSIRFLTLDNKRDPIYNKTRKIDDETKDILSALMEIRKKPIQPNYKFKIVEKGEKKEFMFYYFGMEDIKIKGLNYKSHKFKIVDTNNYVKNLGREATLYLSADLERKILKIDIINHFIGNISIEYR